MSKVFLVACVWAVISSALFAADESAAKAEMAKLEGTWQLVSAINDGSPTSDDIVTKIRVVIKAGVHTVHFGDDVVAKDISFEVDPMADPKTTTDFLPDGQLIKGIYKLEGDMLTSCVAKPGEDRPADFTSAPGSGQTLRIFKRVKE